MRGAAAEYPGKIEAGGKGLASTCPVSRVWMIERGNFLRAGYASTHGYASKLRLRVPVFVVFCCGAWMIERGNFLSAGYASTRGYASKLRLRVPVFVVFCCGAWMIERGNFLCADYASTCGSASKLRLRVPVFVVFCHGAWMIERGSFLYAGYVRVYAWLRVKIKAKSTGVRSVLSWSLDDRTRQFLMCWLRIYAWLRVKIKAKCTSVRSVLSFSSVDIFRDHQFKLIATRSYFLLPATRSRLRVNKKKCRGILEFSQMRLCKHRKSALLLYK